MKTGPYRRLEDLPGIGPSIADDLRRMRITSPAHLATMVPEDVFRDLVRMDGPTDRCVLYVLRCAHYALTNDDPEPSLLRWWAWKDR